ncbi:MAG: type II toxin-antitoxin system VapC family toxin [Actinomycetota bacterium]|nr:type II toxin-antitoxin system VapC family toxin [Actinomycetota bacterium]
MIVADTNVVSEFMKDQPDPAVLGWARTLDQHDVTICVVTVEEIERGLLRLPAGSRRRNLEQRWRELDAGYAGTVLLYDVAAARSTARILVDRAAAGHRLGLADAQIAGICVSERCELATRNRRDFADITGLTIMNPFDS